MCRTVHALMQTVICVIQMLSRVVMTILLMIENMIKMILQSAYNFISFMLQLISLIPICIVFLLTTRLKCLMCGGGGACPVARGGTSDCFMTVLAFVILFFIFRATGVLDKIFYSLGYAKSRPVVESRFVPTPGEITECSRNDTSDKALIDNFSKTTTEEILYYDSEDEETTTNNYYWYYYPRGKDKNKVKGRLRDNKRRLEDNKGGRRRKKPTVSSYTKWTTVVYYLV